MTGGTRGIGEAISKGLKDAGYNVVATYAGNTEKAEAFKTATGIHVYKWDGFRSRSVYQRYFKS